MQRTQQPGAQDPFFFSGTRWLAILVIPFLVAASAILLIWPNDTGRLFAWPIKPPMTAMMLGSAYLGGIYFFIRVLFTRQWHTVKTGFLPVAAFAGLMAIATLIHWDKFTHGNIAFFAWAGVYFVAPFLVLWVWWVNQRNAPRSNSNGGRILPSAARWVLIVVGILELLVGVLLFFAPAVMIPLWPWTLSTLTSRVMGAMVVMPGIGELNNGLAPSWSEARISLGAQILSLIFILVSVARDWASFDPTHPATTLFIGGMGALLVGLAILYVWMELKPAVA